MRAYEFIIRAERIGCKTGPAILIRTGNKASSDRIVLDVPVASEEISL